MRFSRIVLVALVLLLLTVSIGCFGEVQETTKRNKVTAEEVEAFKQNKQIKRVDIYVPLKEQYATSGHNKSLTSLLDSGHAEEFCYECHSAEYFLAPEHQKPPVDSVKYSITCAVCHVMTTGEFKLRLEPLDTCIVCHNHPSEIVPGEVVHHPQKQMFLGYGALGIPETPDVKYQAGLTCIECHMPNESHSFEGKTPAAAIRENTESICIMCHADVSEQQFAEEVERIQNEVKDSCLELNESLMEFREIIAKNKNQGLDMVKVETVYNTVYTNLNFIDADRSFGIHNVSYTRKILERSREQKLILEEMLR